MGRKCRILALGQQQKARRQGRALNFRLAAQLLRWRELRYITFEWLVGLLDEVGIQRADLGRLGDKTLIGVLEVNLLELHRLLGDRKFF